MAIKRAAKTLLIKEPELDTDFIKNKKILEKYSLPDKGTRNKIAGYAVRLKSIEKATKPKIN